MNCFNFDCPNFQKQPLCYPRCDFQNWVGKPDWTTIIINAGPPQSIDPCYSLFTSADPLQTPCVMRNNQIRIFSPEELLRRCPRLDIAPLANLPPHAELANLGRLYIKADIFLPEAVKNRKTNFFLPVTMSIGPYGEDLYGDNPYGLDPFAVIGGRFLATELFRRCKQLTPVVMGATMVPDANGLSSIFDNVQKVREAQERMAKFRMAMPSRVENLPVIEEILQPVAPEMPVMPVNTDEADDDDPAMPPFTPTPSNESTQTGKPKRNGPAYPGGNSVQKMKERMAAKEKNTPTREDLRQTSNPTTVQRPVAPDSSVTTAPGISEIPTFKRNQLPYPSRGILPVNGNIGGQSVQQPERQRFAPPVTEKVVALGVTDRYGNISQIPTRVTRSPDGKWRTDKGEVIYNVEQYETR